MVDLSEIGRRALFALDPETAHGLSIRALASGLPLASKPETSPRLATRIGALTLPNPLGMAAGYDKNGEVPDALLKLGFGFVEIGTVTPLPQAGNARPRIFRLTADGAVINRLGFNNDGHAAVLERLRRRDRTKGAVGVNIGANKDSADRIADYAAGVVTYARVADYLTVNISSPNTPGLRALQTRENLTELLARVGRARGAAKTPVLLKIAPDLTDHDLADIASVLLDGGADGLIVSNTTVAREGLRSPERLTRESGGLSGKPLFARSTTVLARMRILLGAGFPIVGVGGVDSAETLLEKVMAGADAVQLYSGMIYGGPGLPGRILGDLRRKLDSLGVRALGSLRDRKVREWASPER